MYTKAGTKEEGVMFLLTDSQITNERFLVFINDLLASGNIPDLFAPDEVRQNRVKYADFSILHNFQYSAVPDNKISICRF